jgi:hypothetical protein
MTDRPSSKTALLQAAGLTRRNDALFKAMASDFLLREQFASEPTQVLAEFIRREQPDPEQAAVVDQFVFAVMADQALLDRLAADVSDLDERVAPGGALELLVSAAADSSSKTVVAAVVKGAGVADRLVERYEDFAVALVEALRVPGSVVGGSTTEMSTGHTTGTEMSTGHLSGVGAVFSTEMSTGTGTEMSTGHTTGTEMSTGHLTGVTDRFQRGFRGVAFAALAEHAAGLARDGLLDAAVFER